LLTRQRQAEIADQIGVDMYTMMSDVAAAAAEVHDEYLRAREKLVASRFNLAKGVLAVQGEVRLDGRVDAGEAAVGVGIATQLGLRVADIKFAVTGSVRGPAAVYAFSTGEPTLRNLDRCGLLGQILPELEACRTLMPTDTVHTYTVFEHTLRVVRHLDEIPAGSFLEEVKDSLNDLEPLYLAALLHDIGKVHPEQSHSVVGAEMAAELCTRWGLAPNVCETVEWLVREHLTMSRFIRIRDLMNPDTIEEFVQIVGDADRLGYLTLLTWADVNAVGPGAWTSAQDTFLRQLYEFSSARLQGEVGYSPDPSSYRRRLLRQLSGKHGDEVAVQAFVESLPAYYLTSTPPDLVRLHMHFAEKATAGEPTVEMFHRNDLNATEVTVCVLDAPALLSKLLGVFYAFDLSVTGIRACTTMTEPPVALDVFTVSFASRPVPPATCTQVSKAILDVVEGRKTTEDVLHSRGKDPWRDQQIFTYSFVEGTPGILEIRAPRGRGMPYRFSKLIAEQGWNVVSARVGQWAGNATAAFYLLKQDGSPLTRSEVEAALGQP
jgi:[protein-PII] uridylyltransferase